MIPGIPYAARIAVLAQFCTCALAFQPVSEGPIQVRPRPPLAAPASPPVLRVASSLVLIPVHVTTAQGASVTSLRKEDFMLFEDGVKQTITHFAQDDAPVSAGLLLDISSSMKNKLDKASQAATQFFKFANPEDEFFLIEFNSRAKLKVPFTRDWAGIAGEIGAARTSGMTAMLDAIHLAVATMKHARNSRKALIILSDGGDNFSRRNLRELKSTLLEADVQVYAMGVFDNDYSRKHTPEERNGPKLLDQVVLDTGGRDFPIAKLEDLPDIGIRIARELRNQYVLGFAPATSVADGKYHRVNLQLTPPNADSALRTYYRQGYYAPGQ
jgi:Ca-activated chloride channel family protein